MLVDAARAAIAAGAPDSARSIAVATSRRMLRPVINATGTILHTNLGRAPMAWEQPERYTNLELDLTTGQRGSRMATAGALIAKACGAEDAIIVNNCAAAVLLGLGGLAEGRDVAVSRSELVEIGGGFRIPDVMARSGANLIEVGTTNRTRVDDFRGAVDDPDNDVAVVLRVHQSNYTIVGFTEAPTTAQEVRKTAQKTPSTAQEAQKASKRLPRPPKKPLKPSSRLRRKRQQHPQHASHATLRIFKKRTKTRPTLANTII